MSAAKNGQARATPQGDGVFAVSGMLTFDTVPDVFDQSLAWLQKANGSLTVDLKEVERADSAGLALLVEWLRRARARGADVKFANVPEQMQSLARVNGLNQALGIENHD